MPTQKSQAIVQRRLSILECIRRLSGRSERWVTVSEIVGALKEQGYAVEVHSVRRDMKSLLETHQQLECNDNSNESGEAKNGLAHGYRWVGRDQQTNSGITLPEALSLVMVERYLSQSLPVLLNRPLQDVFGKARQVLDLHKKSQITQWPEKICVIQPAQRFLSPVVDVEILSAVHEGLLNNKQLLVAYRTTQTQSNMPKEYTLHPLGLIQRGAVTYLVAMTNDYEDAYLYALHRMTSAKVLDHESRLKPGFSISEFAEKQGHFGSAMTIEFKARICDHLALILDETPLSENQSISSSDQSGYRELTAEVADTWQFRWWIMGEGDRIEVIAPYELRAQIADGVSKAYKYYFDT